MSSETLYYKKHIFCCVNKRAEGHPRGCCESGGASKLRGHLKAKVNMLGIKNVRVNASQCLDRCELGPTMVIYPEGVWYSYKTIEDVDEILESHIQRGKKVKRLLLYSDQTEPRE